MVLLFTKSGSQAEIYGPSHVKQRWTRPSRRGSSRSQPGRGKKKLHEDAGETFGFERKKILLGGG